MSAQAGKMDAIPEPAYVAGEQFVFDYPLAFVTLPLYSEHRGEVVTVVRPLTDKEYDYEGDPMYRVRAADGWEGFAWESELAPLPTQAA